MMVSGSNFEVVPVRRDIHVKAATLCARRTNATAQALSGGFFVSHDRRLLTLDGVRMLAVNPFTRDDTLGSKPS